MTKIYAIHWFCGLSATKGQDDVKPFTTYHIGREAVDAEIARMREFLKMVKLEGLIADCELFKVEVIATIYDNAVTIELEKARVNFPRMGGKANDLTLRDFTKLAEMPSGNTFQWIT